MTYQLGIYKNGVLYRYDKIEAKNSVIIDAVVGFPGLSIQLDYIPPKPEKLKTGTPEWYEAKWEESDDSTPGS